MKKAYALLMAVAVVVLAACGGGDPQFPKQEAAIAQFKEQAQRTVFCFSCVTVYDSSQTDVTVFSDGDMSAMDNGSTSSYDEDTGILTVNFAATANAPALTAAFYATPGGVTSINSAGAQSFTPFSSMVYNSSSSSWSFRAKRLYYVGN